jgi:hypothetical protein
VRFYYSINCFRLFAVDVADRALVVAYQTDATLADASGEIVGKNITAGKKR